MNGRSSHVHWVRWPRLPLESAHLFWATSFCTKKSNFDTILFGGSSRKMTRDLRFFRTARPQWTPQHDPGTGSPWRVRGRSRFRKETGPNVYEAGEYFNWRARACAKTARVSQGALAQHQRVLMQVAQTESLLVHTGAYACGMGLCQAGQPAGAGAPAPAPVCTRTRAPAGLVEATGTGGCGCRRVRVIEGCGSRCAPVRTRTCDPPDPRKKNHLQIQITKNIGPISQKNGEFLFTNC